MQRFYFTVHGPFDVTTESGDSIRPAVSKEAALLAILALSPQYRRSRSWLRQLLWSDRSAMQSAASLRQALSRLRKSLSPYGELLNADNQCVWLEQSHVVLKNDNGSGRLDLLEGMDVNDEMFEDWLRQERISAERYENTTLVNTLTQPAYRPVIQISQPAIYSDDLSAEVFGSALCEQLISVLHSHGLLDILDKRHDAPSTQTSDNRFNETPPYMLIQLRLAKVGRSMRVSFLGRKTHHDRISIALHHDCSLRSQEAIFTTDLSALICRVVDQIHRIALNSSEGEYRSASVYSAVQQLMSHSREGQMSAREYLERMSSEHSDSVATAWCAFSYAVGMGERLETVDAYFYERVQGLCALALEQDPFNPVSRALVGHMYSFIYRDLATAAHHLTLARELAPELAMAWDFSSMHALYCGDLKKGYLYATRAARLGAFSPLKPYIDASVAICASASGKHDEALQVSNRVLKDIPNMLPVMRHMVGSLAATGDYEGASAMIEAVTALDPEFSYANINDPNYPLQSPDSIRVVQQGFELVGLN